MLPLRPNCPQYVVCLIFLGLSSRRMAYCRGVLNHTRALTKSRYARPLIPQAHDGPKAVKLCRADFSSKCPLAATRAARDTFHAPG